MSTKKKSPRGDKHSTLATIKHTGWTALRLLPMSVLLGLLCVVGMLVWQVIDFGKDEGSKAYLGGRYVTADIASGEVKGKLLPPANKVPTSLIPDDAHEATNPELEIPTIAMPEGDTKLRSAPNMSLIETSGKAQLPKQNGDGVKPWEYYARPFTRVQGTTGISVILTGIGINSQNSLAAAKLPADISFSISSYAPKPAAWVQSMRVQGHECFLDLPLQQSQYPLSDPGPQALQPSIMPAENMEHLHDIMGQAVGYVGFVTVADEVFFAAQEDFIDPVAEDLSNRGLALVFSQPKERPILKEVLKKRDLTYLDSHIFVRYGSDAIDIKQQLEAAEAISKQSGHVLIVIEASPVAIEELMHWSQKLRGRGFQLLPASAIAVKKFS